MKRTISVICAAALVMFAACQKEDTTASKVALTATLEQQVDNGATKTALNPTNNVIWSAGDQIIVNTTDGLETLTLDSGQGTTTGSFGSTTGDNPDYAIYPASVNPSLSSSTFTFTLPATQTYAENSFGPGANVAVAAISGNNMSFKNVCGVLKLQLKGSMKVKTIEITGKNGEKLNGTFTVDAAASPFVGAVKSGDPTEAEKKVTLDCSAFGETSEGAADGGVQLDFETATVFNIIVPVDAFAGGFDANITDVDGETFCTTLETTEDNTIARSTITKMPSRAVSLLPSTYKELSFLMSDSRAFINTGVTMSDNPEIIFKFKYNTYYSLGYVFGNYHLNDSYNTIRCMLYNQAGLIHFVMNTIPSNKNIISGFTNSTWYRVNFSNQHLIVDDHDYEIATVASGTPNSDPIIIFNRSGIYSIDRNMECCLSYWRAKNSTGWLRYLIPAKENTGNKLGMYDLISGQFLENANDGGVIPTSEFVAGPELTD